MAAGKKLTTLEFIERSTTIHEGKFDYSKVEYVNTHTAVTIVCPTHGEFRQKPYQHLAGSGCCACSGKQRTSQQDFVERAKQAIGDQYDFVRVVYKNLDTPVTIVCPKHGEFTKKPRLILQQRRGCPKCGQDRLIQKSRDCALTTPEFIERARTLHQNKYLYEKVQYTTGNAKVDITCLVHGDFAQRPANHLRGQGCPKCGDERSGGTGGYTQSYFDRTPEAKLAPAIVYLVDITINDKERCIKVGITTKTTDMRFDRSEYRDMTITPLHISYMSLYDAFVLEQRIMEQKKTERFFSNVKFSGYTECFKLSTKDDIIELMKGCGRDRNI